ncbi:MAG: DUF365 domain-containing protein [Methanocellales archaeon]|nr:DUF365 domain-containing protein [Methanocellales archaeon]
MYPLPEEYAIRLLDKDIFVKYQPHDTTSVKFREGSKLLIYVSGGKKEILGEGVITKIEFLFLDEILKEYEDRLFITKKELLDYSKDRKNKRLLVLTVKNFEKYEPPIKYDKPITMTGKYMNFEEHSSLLGSCGRMKSR